MLTSVTGRGSSANPREPMTISLLGYPYEIKIEETCQACNGSGEAKINGFHCCEVCKGSGCVANENGKNICQLILDNLVCNDCFLRKR